MWNDTYFGSGSQSGGHPDNANTAYVHVYETTHEAYTDSVTVIQYFYFYPYNHWWNRHEGDWQRVHVVVNSRNPNDVNIEVLGVEYLIHKAHLSYYKDFPITHNLLGQTVEDSGRTYPDLTSRFVFNPRRNIKLSQGSHPVVYVGAGSHASFPAGGKIRIYDKDIEFSSDRRLGYEIHERMTHTGLVLSTQADGAHGDLWESYDLVVLPEPDPTNANNMGLTDSMSWLGADVLWGTPSVDSPDSDIPVIGQQGNESPQGPYHKGWEELKFFRQGSTGGDFKFLFIDTGHPFRYKDVPDSYHHWIIIGQESWNETASASDDTLSLSGDVVVFPGATLTINAGTVVEFEPGSDRHQFSAGSTGVANRTEIFVYGTLVANGTVTDSVRFQKSDTAWQGDSAWGGIRIMEGGSVTLHHTGLRDHSRPRIGPTGLSAHAGRGEATLRWDNQSLSDPSITGWEYRTKPESATQWGDWTAVSGRATREALVSNLAHGVLHQFEVRAVNTTGGGPASAVSVALLQVVFVSSSYELIEGGQAVAAGPVGLAEDPSQAYRRARVTLQVTPAPSAAVRIPVAVAPGSSGYEVDDLDAAGLPFPASRASASFVVRAVRDADTEDEAIELSFGTLPAEVVAGVPSSSTVTIYDTPNQPTGLTATPGHGRMTLRWTDPKHSGIAGWQYWAQPVGTARDIWTTIEGSGASTTEATVPNLTDGKEYNFRVRAYTRGYGVASEMVKATPTGLQATAYNGAVGLAWVDPGTEGLSGWRTRHQPLPSGEPSSYTVHADGVGTHVVRGLSNDTEYRFEVQGLNAAGEVLDPCPWRMTHPCTWQAVATPKASLSWPPNVAGELSLSSTSPQVNAAVTATLSDLDGGVRDTTWQWQRRRAATEQWTAVDEATSSSHAPATGDLGYMLRATVDYADRHGPGQRAESEATAAVVAGPPGVPQDFQAVAGDGQVLVTWAAPASTGGLPLRGYHYREIVAGDTTAWFDFLTDWTRYLRRELSNGVAHTFEVRAFNRSGAGASVDTTVTPAGAPRAPGDFKAEPGDGQVSLSWTAADSNGAPITAYEVRHAPKSHSGAEMDWTGVDWSAVPGDSTARDTTITGLSNGTRYVFQAAARNRVGLGTPAEKAAAPQGLVILAPDTVWFAENRPDSVATLSTDPEGDAVTWSRAGADAALFEVRGDTLHFETAPDFEEPGDADEDNFYEVTLTATDDGEPAASASHEMTVAVTNVNEPGTLTLSPSTPKTCEHVEATLTDEDAGIVTESAASPPGFPYGWQWIPQTSAASGSATSTTRSYLPASSLVGQTLRVTVQYGDRASARNTATRTSGAVAANTPRTPTGLKSTAGDGQVALTWTAPDDCGSTITGYRWRYRKTSQTAWADSGTAADTSLTVPGLDNDVAYRFEIRAANGQGRSRPAAIDETPVSTPVAAPCALSLSGLKTSPVSYAENGTGSVDTYTVTRSSSCDATLPLTWSRAGTDASDFRELSGTGSSRSLQFNNAPNFEAKSAYRVTVQVTDGSASASLPVTVQVTDVNEAPSITGPGQPTIDENSRPVGTYTASDPDAGDVITWLSLSGVEASLFQLSDLSPAQALKRELSFRSAPDFESRGSTYEVQVRVRDKAGLNASLRVTVSVRNVDEPGSVTFDKSTIRVGDSVTATLTDPDGGMTNDRWTWTAVAPGPSGQDEHDPISSSRTARAPEIGYRLKAAVTYDDRQGTGKSAQALTSVIQIPVNRPPVLTGSSTVTRDENGPSPWTVTTYTASDPDNPTTLYFTHRGDQAGYFQLTGSGNSRTLEFKNKPDYETRHTYKVRVIVSDKSNGGLKDSVSTTVTLNDIDDPGKVVITNTAPRVGQRITAKLYDEDSDVSNDLWFWVALSSGASGTQSLRPEATSHAYTIKDSDVGKVLEATVEYDDGDGHGKSAYTRSNTVSASPPGAPKSFTASRGDGEVYLSWGEADDNGSDITHYETRHKEQTASTWSGWSQAAQGAKARADTVATLTNGTAYAFEVRAENAKGEGPAASASATPAGRPGAPKSLATARPGPGQASISWEAADANGSDITRYQYRRRVGTTGPWRGWFTVTGGGGARSRTVSGLSDASAYTWEVRAENGEGFGPAASIYQPPAGPGGNLGQVPDSEGDNLGDNEGEPDTPMEDESDDTATAKPAAGGLAAPAALHVTTAPNPFNSSTTLFLHLPTAGPVTLTVYNTAGQAVAELARGENLGAGRHAREWYGTDERGRPLASGLYLYRLIAGGQVRVGKIALIR